MNGARDFACRNVRAALGLERAGLAVMLAREVNHRAVLRQPLAWLETGNFAGVKRRVGAAAWGGTQKGRGDQAFETRLATDLGARH
jgi:hypothetical protein